MPTASQLDGQTAIILALMGDSKTAQRQYPDNEWGTALEHYDAHIEWFGAAKLETKEEAIRQDTINQLYSDKEPMGSWAEWHKNNPKLPSIPYNSSTYEAMKRSLEFIKNAPEPIRDCLVYLADGNELVHEDLFTFLQLYAEFIASVEILYSYDPYVDPLKNRREAWNKTNRERWRHFAALRIKEIMKNDGVGIELAKGSIACDIRDALIGKKKIPEGWTKDEYSEFLVEPEDPNLKFKNAYNARLRNACGGNLTRKDLDQYE